MRQRTYSAINILGLTTGVSASLLILLFVADELSYDRFHLDANDIYRVHFDARLGDQEIKTTQTGMPLAESLQNEAAGVKSVLRMDKWVTCPVRFEDRVFTEMNFCLADSNFFSFFDFNLIAGSPDDVLRGPNKIVISESAAMRYFNYSGPGDRSPIGKTLEIGSTGDVTAEVTGIVEDAPANSHVHYDFIMSLETAGYYASNLWINTEVYSYFKVFPGTDITQVQHTLDEFVEKYCAAEIKQFLDMTPEQFLGRGGHVKFITQPLIDIHLKSQ
jgi:putative ABC transport system permease protein